MLDQLRPGDQATVYRLDRLARSGFTFCRSGGGNMLLKAGAVFAGDLTPDNARVMALLALPITKEQKALQAYNDK